MTDEPLSYGPYGTRTRWILWGVFIHAVLLFCAAVTVWAVIYAWRNR